METIKEIKFRKQTYLNWIGQMLWFIGWIILCLLLFDLRDAKETFYWLKIHSTHRASVGKIKIPIKQRVINFLVMVLGCVPIGLLIYLISRLL